MKRILKIFLALVATVLLASACGKSKDGINIVDYKIERIAPASFTSGEATVLVTVHNPYRAFTLANCRAFVLKDGETIGELMCPDVLVEGHCDADCQVVIKGHLVKNTQYRTLFDLLSVRDLKGFTVDVKADLKFGRTAVKRLKMKDIALEELINGQ